MVERCYAITSECDVPSAASWLEEEDATSRKAHAARDRDQSGHGAVAHCLAEQCFEGDADDAGLLARRCATQGSP